MGWITTHRIKGQSNDDFFRGELPCTLVKDGEIVASGTVGGVYYAAVRTFSTGDVWALVILTQRSPRSHHNFGYKDMDETRAQGCYDAPAKVLDALTSTTDKYALEWRAACRTHAEKKATTKLAPGEQIRFPKGLTFRHRGEMVDAYVFEFEARNVFRVVDHPERFRVSIPNWKTAAYERVGA